VCVRIYIYKHILKRDLESWLVKLELRMSFERDMKIGGITKVRGKYCYPFCQSRWAFIDYYGLVTTTSFSFIYVVFDNSDLITIVYSVYFFRCTA